MTYALSNVPQAGSWKGEAPPPPTAAPAPAGTDKKAPGTAEPKAGSPAAKGGKGGGQKPEEAANVAKTPDAARRFVEGMEAVGRLHDRAEKDPETAGEIHAHLDSIRKKFGFTKLDPRLEGDYWVIDAALNSSTKGSNNPPKVKADPTSASSVAPNHLADVPGINEFAAWFNALSDRELDQVWAQPKLRRKIESRLRYPGGMHEWHLVSRAPVFKRWKLTAEQIWDMRSKIDGLDFQNPPGAHGEEGSTKAHNEMLEIIDTSLDYATFKRRLQTWADYRVVGGANALPAGLRR